MNGHSTDEESKERRPREEQKENRGEENSISWIALHHRHLHLQLQQQVSCSLHFNCYVPVAGVREQFTHACRLKKKELKGNRATGLCMLSDWTGWIQPSLFGGVRSSP